MKPSRLLIIPFQLERAMDSDLPGKVGGQANEMGEYFRIKYPIDHHVGIVNMQLRIIRPKL